MTEPTDKPLLDDQQLDEYLKGDSSVSRQYRQLPSDEIPPSLDRLVLRQAEDAVKRSSRPAWVRWTAPLAVAASAVLVVSIVMQTGLRDETMVSAPVAQGSIEAKELKKPAPAAPKAEEAPPPVVYVDLNGPNAPVPFAPPAEVNIEIPAAAPAFAPAAPAAPAEAEIQQELARSEEADKASFADDVSRQKSVREDSAREEEPALAEDARLRERAVAQRATPKEQAQAAGAANAPPAAVLSYSRPISASAADNVATIQRAYTDPEAWLKDIRQLRKDNKQEEADREWRRFREAFPDYDVAETDSAREAKR
jgi:hypothetical protein